MSIKYSLACLLGRSLPPIIAQNLRGRIISIGEGENLNKNFVKKSITGSYFYGNTSDFHAFVFSVHGYYDWRNIALVNEILKHKKGDIIEVGSNIGTETISYSDIAKKYGYNVYAFEPLPSNLKWLNRIKLNNNLDNLHISDLLVSDYQGSAYFEIPKGNNSGSGHIIDSKNSNSLNKFKVVSLDTYLNISKIAVIAVDVEGFELNVIRGAENIINKYRPILILEVIKKFLRKRAKISLDDFYEYLLSLDYECFSISRFGLKKINPKNYQDGGNKNWLCIPSHDINISNKLNRVIFKNAIKPLPQIN